MTEGILLIQADPVGTSSPFFFSFVYLFIYFCLCWVLIAARELSLVASSGGYSLVSI